MKLSRHFLSLLSLLGALTVLPVAAQTPTTSTGAAPAAAITHVPVMPAGAAPAPAPTLSTATMVLDPARNLVGSFSSTSCGRSRSSLRPLMFASFLVETTAPSTLARNIMVRGCSP